MKNVLSYYYNLHFTDIHRVDGIYKFSSNGFNYAFLLYSGNINELNDLHELSRKLLQIGIFSHQLIPNKDQSFITYANGKPYVLLQLYNSDKSNITIDDINKFSFISSKIDLPSKLQRSNWSELWQQKIDYFEYQVNQFGKKNPYIRESFSYFSGLVENGISLFNSLKPEYNLLSVSHRRLNSGDTLFDFYNPLNYVVDYKVRDACEYFKSKFIDRQNILDEIISYLSNENLNMYEILLFYVRMFYPSFYFDKYEYIINNEEDDCELKQIIDLAQSYEDLLKELYQFLSNYINMPDIEWIKKT